MKIPYRVLLLLTVALVCSPLCIAQTPAKEPTASVAGHVTIGGKAVPGITIVATLRNSWFDNKTVAKTTTDEDGNYKLNGLANGRFTILALAKSYVMTSGSAYKEPGQVVNITEGEAITKIDFPLVRGGVITGRITGSDGHSIIDERVSVVKVGEPESGPQAPMFDPSRNQTDDRGVYRAYGLGPGNYRVSVGEASANGAVTTRGMGESHYIKTFFPGVQDESKATLVEIKEGAEVSNVDITVTKPGSGFTASGRVIDADSGKPVVGVYIGHSSVNESSQQMGDMNFTGIQTDANGGFRLEGLQPGHHAAYTVATGRDTSTYSDPVSFEISDGDVTGIEIKLRRGSIISGVAVIDNNPDPAITALLQTVTVYAFVEAKGLSTSSYGSGAIGADGSFRIAGLAPGKARIGVQSFPQPPKGLSLVRTEIDGLEQKEGIEVAAGAEIKGVRLLFAYGTGSVRGDVKIEGGTVPEGMTFRVLVRSAAGDSRRFWRQAELDARLHFLLENIPPGSYELVVNGTTPTTGPKSTPTVELLKQTVTVANGTELKVNLVVNVNAQPGGQP